MELRSHTKLAKSNHPPLKSYPFRADPPDEGTSAFPKGPAMIARSTQIFPRRLSKPELSQHGFILQSDGTFINPTRREQRVVCRKCAKWVTQTTASRPDVPNGYCKTCARQHRAQHE